jgi:hypothetical protein
MFVEKSRKAFLEERLNCAQSVLRAFQEIKNLSEEQIKAAKAYGGGRAPGGRCGALHAALELISDVEGKNRLAKSFSEEAGSEICKEIRKLRKVSCGQCVELATGLAQSNLGLSKGR